jgi:phosphoglucomutase
MLHDVRLRRDKDAVTASMMFAEMEAYYHDKGMTLADAMTSLYEKYGWYGEKTLNLVMPGIDGLEKMQKLMKVLRENPPKNIAWTDVLRQRDYASGKISVPALGVVGKTDILGSDVLYFELEDDSSISVRPSGTEPKIKVYLLVRGETRRTVTKIAKYEEYAIQLSKLQKRARGNSARPFFI